MHVIKRGKRNALSRPFHAQEDEKVITAWKLNLDGIRSTSEVRPFPCIFAKVPNFRLQTELAENADPGAHDVLTTHSSSPILHAVQNISSHEVRSDVLNAHDVVSNTHHNAVYTHPVDSQVWRDPASGIPSSSSTRRNKLGNLGDVDGKNQPVSTLILHTSVAEHSRIIN